MSIGVDPDCVELARKFLADSARFLAEEKLEADVLSLSEAIQTAIEDWFFAAGEPK